MIPELLVDFFTKKSIQGLAIGSTLQEIQVCLGEPDDIAILGRKRKTLIHKYGQIEFYFKNSICNMIQFTFYGKNVVPIHEIEILELLSLKRIDYKLFPGLTLLDQTCYLTSNYIYIVVAVDEGGVVKKIYTTEEPG